VILLTRFNGPAFALNPDLIERADHTPDTVITLVDGTKYVIAESLSELMLIMRRHRAGVLADAEMLINGQFREAAWPPAGQAFTEQGDEQARGPVLEPVRQLHPAGPERGQAAASAVEHLPDRGQDGTESQGPRPVEQMRQAPLAGRDGSDPGPASSVAAQPQSDVIPLHRRGK
jgi:flagellar protein FlbD